ncbi:hypothetical protein, partial [Acinetobacter johnsonii]|uniref:hypothetical protein n=1 Tax=Acinetobacter johnsonii TaxID=40214 RepID=UPI001F3CC213
MSVADNWGLDSAGVSVSVTIARGPRRASVAMAARAIASIRALTTLGAGISDPGIMMLSVRIGSISRRPIEYPAI